VRCCTRATCAPCLSARYLPKEPRDLLCRPTASYPHPSQLELCATQPFRLRVYDSYGRRVNWDWTFDKPSPKFICILVIYRDCRHSETDGYLLTLCAHWHQNANQNTTSALRLCSRLSAQLSRGRGSRKSQSIWQMLRGVWVAHDISRNSAPKYGR
jgi:hypothetical protein